MTVPEKDSAKSYKYSYQPVQFCSCIAGSKHVRIVVVVLICYMTTTNIEAIVVYIV